MRWISRGTPTSLVRDGQHEANDPPPPDRAPVRPFVPAHTTFGSSDPRRAGQGGDTDVDYGTVAMDAGVIYNSTGTDSAIAPSDGGALSAWPTSFDIKMRKRARKKRRAERWHRWLGRTPA